MQHLHVINLCGPWVPGWPPWTGRERGFPTLLGTLCGLFWFAPGPWVLGWPRGQNEKNPSGCQSRCQNTSHCSGHQGWETLLSCTPTQLRLSHSLAHTTRTRNEMKTDFPIGGQLRRLISLNLWLMFLDFQNMKVRKYFQNVCWTCDLSARRHQLFLVQNSQNKKEICSICLVYGGVQSLQDVRFPES